MSIHNPIHALCDCSAIPDGGAKACDFEGIRYIAIRDGKNYQLYLNRCPHLGIPLEWQPDQFMDAEGEFIRCSTHGALFELTSGRCFAGPCVGDALTKIPFTIIDNTIWI